MVITIERRYKKTGYTIGICSVNGRYFCESVEDEDRGLLQSMSLSEIKSRKVYGETAIPRGTYDVQLTYSPKFAYRNWGIKYQGMVPQIMNVPGYEGVRIHPANTAKDLLGCVAVGENKIKGGVINSTAWYYKLMDLYIVPASSKGEKITINIK